MNPHADAEFYEGSFYIAQGEHGEGDSLLVRGITKDIFGIYQNDEGSYTITHLLTGWAIAELMEIERAKEIVRRFIAVGLDFGFEDPKACPKDLGGKVAQVLREALAG